MKKATILIGLILLMSIFAGCDLDLSDPTYEERCDEWCYSNATTFTIAGGYHSGYNKDKCDAYCKPSP